MNQLPENPRLLVFDLDGTLTDSMGHIVETMVDALQEHDLMAPDHATILPHVGIDLALTVEALHPRLPPARVRAVVDTYCDLYATRDHARGAPLFEGARELLDAYHTAGQWMAVATGKSTRGLRKTFEAHALAPYFLTWRTAEQTFPKPNPMMLREILDECGVLAEEAVMIGDTVHDLRMAREVGVASVAVTTGGLPAETLAAEGAALVLERAADLRDHLPPSATGS